MIVELALAGLCFAAVTGWGQLILGTLRLDGDGGSDPDRVLLWPLAGLIATALVGSVLWITGGFVRPIAVLWAATGVCLLLWNHYLGERGAWRDLWQTRQNGSWGAVLWGGAILLMIPVLLAPDTSWDSGMYHLVVAKHAALNGQLPLRLDDIFILHLFSCHVLLGWGFLVGGSEADVTARALLALLPTLSVAIAARRVGRRFSPRLGLIALAMVLSSPIWFIQWGTALIDVPIFALASVGLALVTGRPNSRAAMGLGIAALALAAASKHWGLLAPVALAVIWTGEAARSREWRRFAQASLLGAACLVAASPWIIKNQIVLGNPLAIDIDDRAADRAEKYSLFDTSAPALHLHPEESRSGLSFAWAVLRRISTAHPVTAAACPLLFAWIPFALWGRRPRWWWAAWAGALTTIVLFVALLPGLGSEAPNRYFFEAAPFLFFLAALGCYRWMGTSVTRQRLAWLLLAFAALPGLGFVSMRAWGKVPVAFGLQSAEAHWATRDSSYGLASMVGRLVKPEDRLLFVGARPGVLPLDPDQLIRPYRAHLAGVASAATLRDAMSAWGVDWVIVNDDPGEPWNQGIQRDWAVPESVALAEFERVAERGNAVLYRHVDR